MRLDQTCMQLYTVREYNSVHSLKHCTTLKYLATFGLYLSSSISCYLILQLRETSDKNVDLIYLVS